MKKYFTHASLFLLLFLLFFGIKTTTYADSSDSNTDPNCSEEVERPSCYGQSSYSDAHEYKVTGTEKAGFDKYGYIHYLCQNCKEARKDERLFPVNSYTITLSKSTYSYDGKAKCPKLNIYTYEGKPLSKDYYKITYKNNTKVGKATAKLTLKGAYSGSKSFSFKIQPAKPSSLKLSCTGTNRLKLSWKKQNNSAGVQVRYASDKAMKDPIVVTLKGKKQKNVTLKNLTGDIKYYVQLRTYALDSKGKKYYSSWSDKKNCKVKEKGYNEMTAQEQVIYLVNQQRKSYGLVPLVQDPALQKVADLRAVELTSLYSHSRPNGQDCFSAYGIYKVKYHTAGENIAAGFTSAAWVMDGWMNSPGHRANILNPEFRRIGAGFSYSGYGYSYYWSQNFAG